MAEENRSIYRRSSFFFYLFDEFVLCRLSEIQRNDARRSASTNPMQFHRFVTTLDYFCKERFLTLVCGFVGLWTRMSDRLCQRCLMCCARALCVLSLIHPSSSLSQIVSTCLNFRPRPTTAGALLSLVFLFDQKVEDGAVAFLSRSQALSFYSAFLFFRPREQERLFSHLGFCWPSSWIFFCQE